jgi:SAM-dependent methyltransferase
MATEERFLDEVVPWGRSFEEYCRMFDFSPNALPDSILDCGAGPSSFRAEASNQSERVVAVDPIYEFSGKAIRRKFEKAAPKILSMLQTKRERFVLDGYESPVEVVEGRQESLEVFLDDFAEKRDDERYRDESVLNLSFDPNEFDLALSSHFLFLYDDQLSEDFHRRAVRKILTVAKEFRIFPLYNMNAEPSAHLQPVTEELSQNGYDLEVHEVTYEFQRGANQMLVVQ